MTVFSPGRPAVAAAPPGPGAAPDADGTSTWGRLRLHVPDEPVAHRAMWATAVFEGQPLATVVAGDDGVAVWLWRRWRALETAGVDEVWLRAIVLSYQRELGLWLAGDRPWGQCCSGLVGRVSRRLPPLP